MAPTTTTKGGDPVLSHGNVANGLAWDHYRKKSGTSMAAPHVSGAIALLRQLHPDWTKNKITEALEKGAEPVGTAANHKFTFGHGWLNIEKTVNWAINNP